MSESGDKLVVTNSMTGEQILPDYEALDIAESRTKQAEERIRELEARLRALGMPAE